MKAAQNTSMWDDLLRILPGYDPFIDSEGYYFDEEAALRVIGFAETLTHIKGELAGEFLVLEEWQKGYLANLFGWKKGDPDNPKEDDPRRYTESLLFIPRKNGKALALNTPIPTPDGWTDMGDLSKGDVVFDENGEQCSVVDVTEVMHDRPCYRVSFADGTSIVADENHEWQVAFFESIGIKTTKELFNCDSCCSYFIPNNMALKKFKANSGMMGRIEIVDMNEIVSVEPVESVPVKCIQVDSPSHLYLAGRGMTPTHNSFLASCICLYMFFCDGELGAEIVCAAFEQNQARLVWDVCRHQINANPDLKGACKTFQHSIVIDGIASTLKPISAESRSAHGFNLHCAVMDELHVQRDDELVVALQTSMGSRKQPLMIHITTSDYERESVCNKIYDYAKQVMDPNSKVVDPTFLPGIYEALITDDWTIEETWKKANPNYGVSVRPEYLQKMCEKAKNDPTFENEFKRLHLNIRTEQSVRYLQMADWDKCGGVVEKESLLGRACSGGLDLSINEDLSAFVLVFPNDDGGYDILPKFYSPRERALARKKKYGVDYLAWAKQGFITLTEGDVIDYDFIMEDIRKASELYNLVDVGYDKWNAEHFRQTVEAEGICRMVEFPQNFSSMNEPMKTMVSLLRETKINHGGHPVLRWNASNLMAKTDPNGRVRPIKQKVEQKIDGIVAMIIGIGRAMFGEVVQASVYESGNGILEI